jgi:hypothetical protein
MLYECKNCDYRTQFFFNFERHLKRKYQCDKKKKIIDAVNNSINEGGSNVPNDGSNVPNDGSNVPNDGSNVPNDGSNVVVNNGVTYTCTKCSKDFSCSRTLNKHFDKCNGVLSRQCPVCFKVFKNRKNKYYHIQHQTCEPPTSEDKELTINGSNMSTVNTQSTNECAANYNNSQHCTTNFNKVTNQNIHFNVFGKENLDYLLNDPNILQRLKKHCNKGVYGMADIVEEVHCNEDQPQNNTIIKPIDYGKGVYIKGDDSKWEYREFEDIRSTLIDTISKYVKMYNKVKYDRNVRLSDRKEWFTIQKWSYILLSLHGDIPDDLYDELKIDAKQIDDKKQTIHKLHRSFDKTSMIKINDFSSNHVKKQKGKYILT